MATQLHMEPAQGKKENLWALKMKKQQHIKHLKHILKTHQDLVPISMELQIHTEPPPPHPLPLRGCDVKMAADTGIISGISTDKYSDQPLINRSQAAIHTALYGSESLCNHHSALSKTQTALSHCIIYSNIQ